jgi:hypothetical protein
MAAIVGLEWERGIRGKLVGVRKVRWRHITGSGKVVKIQWEASGT